METTGALALLAAARRVISVSGPFPIVILEEDVDAPNNSARRQSRRSFPGGFHQALARRLPCPSRSLRSSTRHDRVNDLSSRRVRSVHSRTGGRSGDGRTLATFVEGKEERLIFFPRPGQAGIVTFSVEAWDEDALSTRQATLTRDAQYRYALDGRWVQVLASTRERVQCAIVQREAGRPARVTLQTAVFWPFVFGTTTDPQALFRAQISAAHAAALLGLSMLTVSRRIGEGKFPAVRSHSKYPGIDQAGLVEYMAYRRQFPQGHPNLLRVEAWQREWRHTYRAGVVAMLSSDSAGGSLCHEPQESIPR